MSAELRKDAKRLASKGRRGDKNLLHITDEELLALYASGKVTRNPKTGLPEASFFSNLFDPGGLVSGAIGRYDPIGSSILEATDWAPGSAGSLYTAMQQEESGNPFGAEASAFDIFAGGTSESRDPDKRKIGRAVGSMFAGYGLGQAFGGAAGATGAEAGGEAAFGEGLSAELSAGAPAAGGTGFSMPAAVPELAANNAVSGEVTAFSGMDNAVTQGAAGTSGVADFGGGTFETFDANPSALSNDIFQGADLQGSFGGEAGPGGTGGATYGAEPAGQSYYQQFLDWMKKRGMVKTGMQGMNLVSGIYGMNKASQLEKLAQAASPMRTQAVSDAAALQADPSRVTSLPGYKAGLQAVERRMAAQGYLGSGNMMVALRDYGGKQYDTELARLTALAQPSATELQGTIAANQMRNQSLQSLGYAAMGLFS